MISLNIIMEDEVGSEHTNVRNKEVSDLCYFMRRCKKQKKTYTTTHSPRQQIFFTPFLKNPSYLLFDYNNQ